MVKTQRQFTLHEMEMMIQAAAILFLKKGSVCHRDCNCFFGANKATIAAVWRLMSPDISGKLRIKHLLLALTFLKQYSCEKVLSWAADCTPKTFRKRVLEMLTALNKQHNDVVSTNLWFSIYFFDVLNLTFLILKINLENIFLADNGSACKMSVDGTNFKINQPQNFETKWFSHKFRGTWLHYKVALNIQTGDIVWSHGPFPPGAHTDLAIFLQGLAHKLKPGEGVEADKGNLTIFCFQKLGL